MRSGPSKGIEAVASCIRQIQQALGHDIVTDGPGAYIAIFSNRTEVTFMLGGYTSTSTAQRNKFDPNATAGLSGKEWRKLEAEFEFEGNLTHKWKRRYGASFMGRDEEGRFQGVARFLLIPSGDLPSENKNNPAIVLSSSTEYLAYWIANNEKQVVPPGLFPLLPCSEDAESLLATLHNKSSGLPNGSRFGETGVGIISCGPGPAGLDARPFYAGIMNLKIAGLACMKRTAAAEKTIDIVGKATYRTFVSFDDEDLSRLRVPIPLIDVVESINTTGDVVTFKARAVVLTERSWSQVQATATTNDDCNREAKLKNGQQSYSRDLTGKEITKAVKLLDEGYESGVKVWLCADGRILNCRTDSVVGRGSAVRVIAQHSEVAFRVRISRGFK